MIRRYKKTIVRWVKGQEVREEVLCVDETTGDLDHLTPEEREAGIADFNGYLFCRMLGDALREQAAQKVEQL